MHYDKQISKNIWCSLENIIAKLSKVLPSFSREVCIKHFIRMFLSVMPTRQFAIPSCIPLLEKPSTPFNFDPRSYQKVANIIRKMKISESLPARSDISDIL